MTSPAAARLISAIEATWPPARVFSQGPFLLRDGQGGGKRVSAATAEGPVAAGDLAAAEAAMQGLGQDPLFMIREGEDPFDAMLADRGYAVVDPVQVLAAPLSRLTDRPVPRLVGFCLWEPLAIMRDIWSLGGVGPARIEVMARAPVKTAVLVRWKDRAAGVGFAAVDGDIAMVHAVEVLPAYRRQGVAGWIMRQAAHWAAEQGAGTMAVLCTRANLSAQALYSGLGFEPITGYHYRQKVQGDARRDD